MDLQKQKEARESKAERRGGQERSRIKVLGVQDPVHQPWTPCTAAEPDNFNRNRTGERGASEEGREEAGWGQKGNQLCYVRVPLPTMTASCSDCKHALI